jgi:hypothetical protein
MDYKDWTERMSDGCPGKKRQNTCISIRVIRAIRG